MEAMTIQGTQIQIKEYKGKRVVTFKDIDTVHQRPDGTARKRFNDNRKRFVSGVDFYKINQPSEIRALGITRPQGGTPQEATLITESGYLMLVKSFTDDLAWKVQRDLVDTYFRVRAEPTESVMRKVIEDEIPTVIVDTDKLIKCAEIMAGCLEGNRPYVLNILRQIIPDIEKQESLKEVEVGDEVVQIPDISNKTIVKTSRTGYRVGFNNKKFNDYLRIHGITSKELSEMSGVSKYNIANYRNSTPPGSENRHKICYALGVSDTYFDKRTRNTR